MIPPREGLYAPAFVQALFDRMAASYDRVSSLTSFGFSIRWRKAFLGKLPQGANVRVLDLMTGRGELLPLLVQKSAPEAIYALDFSAGMLEGVRKMNKDKFGNQLHIVAGDALAMPFENLFFDALVCGFGLKTLNNAQTELLATEVYRILKPGGSGRFIEVSVPPGRVLRLLYGFHLGRVVPFLGKLLLGNPASYRMLWQYNRLFQNAAQAAEIFRKQGFTVIYKRYFYGCATGFTIEKPLAAQT